MPTTQTPQVELITPCWPAPKNVKTASTCRVGGVSQGCYQGLNLAQHVGDNEPVVLQNRLLLRGVLQLPCDPVWLEQVHGTRVVNLDSDSVSGTIKADAVITSKMGITCAVMTADCLPILLCDQQGSMVAAVHAGWRGLLQGVVENTVKKFAKPECVMAWLGPAIGPTRFEVGEEVRREFVDKKQAMGVAFKQRESGQYLADLYRLARITLLDCGVKKIYGGEHCTYNESDKFYSYRRDSQTGRMASLIWLQS